MWVCRCVRRVLWEADGRTGWNKEEPCWGKCHVGQREVGGRRRQESLRTHIQVSHLWKERGKEDGEGWLSDQNAALRKPQADQWRVSKVAWVKDPTVFCHWLGTASGKHDPAWPPWWIQRCSSLRLSISFFSPIRSSLWRTWPTPPPRPPLESFF